MQPSAYTHNQISSMVKGPTLRTVFSHYDETLQLFLRWLTTGVAAHAVFLFFVVSLALDADILAKSPTLKRKKEMTQWKC